MKESSFCLFLSMGVFSAFLSAGDKVTRSLSACKAPLELVTANVG